MINLFLPFGIFVVLVFATGDVSGKEIQESVFAFRLSISAVAIMFIANIVFLIALKVEKRGRFIVVSGAFSVVAGLIAIIVCFALLVGGDYFAAPAIMIAAVFAFMAVALTFRVKDHVSCSIAFYLFMMSGWLIKIYF